MKLPHRALSFLVLLCVPAIHAQDEPEAEPQAPERPIEVFRADGAFEGYTLFAPLNSTSVFLIDMDGEVVHEWTTELAPGGGQYFLPNGHLLRCAREEGNPRFRGGGIGGRVQRFDWDGELVWEYVLANGEETQHHDVEPLPNGNLLLIAWGHKEPIEAVDNGRDRRFVGKDGLWPDSVLEIRPTLPSGGEVVWRWSSWDHLVQDYDAERAGFAPVARHPGRIDINADYRDAPPLTEEELKKLEQLESDMRDLGYVGGDEEEEVDDRKKRPDWLHTNAVAYHAEYDLIALSVPNYNEVWVIDHSTTTEEAAGSTGGRWGRGGEILWRWGNPKNYGAPGEQRFGYQHDPTWVAGDGPGELRLLVFNNGGPGGRSDEASEVVELVLPFDPETGFRLEPGAAFGPAEPAWVYRDPGEFYSPFISGAQRLPNGNTLICSGVDGRVFEVTEEGRKVWEFVNPRGGEVPPSDQAPRAPRTALFRAARIAPDHPGLAGRLTDR